LRRHSAAEQATQERAKHVTASTLRWHSTGWRAATAEQAAQERPKHVTTSALRWHSTGWRATATKQSAQKRAKYIRASALRRHSAGGCAAAQQRAEDITRSRSGLPARRCFASGNRTENIVERLSGFVHMILHLGMAAQQRA
jgi:hypothetical protein